MAVEGVSDFIMSNVIKDSVQKQNKDLSMDDFLQLMVAQLQNQDMFSPTDNSQFITQMAQFSMVNALMGMSEITNMSYSTSLIGKMATAAFLDGGKMIIDEGIIEAVYLFNGTAQVVINDKPYDLSNIMTINDVAKQAEASDKLTDNSALIGKTARLLNITVEGGAEDVTGRITGLRLIDGKTYAIINDRAYPITAINALHETADQTKVDDAGNKEGAVINSEGKNGADNPDSEARTDTTNYPDDVTGTGAAENPEDKAGEGNPDDMKESGGGE